MNALPVWPTTKAILVYSWRERLLALKYAAIPVFLLILMDTAATLSGIDLAEDRLWLFGSNLAVLVACAPLVVTWYRTIVFGHDAAAARPWFTLGKLEGWVIATNLLVALSIVAIAAVLVGVIFLISAGVSQINTLIGQGVAVALAIPAGFLWVMAFTRLSLSVAYAAAGEHLTMREAWRITKPIGFSFTWIHIILAVLGTGIAFLAVGLVSLIGDAILDSGVSDDSNPTFELVLSVTNTIFSMVYLLLSATLFGFVYRALSPTAITPSQLSSEI